ncbi:GatB/YqeY domain-containing protein [Clostridium sediminicola]|uniref:GatB/YqeY domain-containing protein n=1 Tax=Clostridium sediminicola TaxID=3114879 RepID=UPI0031F246B1
MSLKEKIQEDWKLAMKAKDRFKASTISMAKSAILLVEKDEKRILEDEDIYAIISKEIKKRKEASEDFRKGNRQDLVDQTLREIEILSEYLPEQLTEEEISNIVSAAVKETGAVSMKDMGKVMKFVSPKIKGRADGKLVSTLVRQQLSNN